MAQVTNPIGTLTRILSNKFEHRWIMQNEDNNMQWCHCLRSTTFASPSPHAHMKWYIEFYPAINPCNDAGYFDIRVYQVGEQKEAGERTGVLKVSVTHKNTREQISALPLKSASLSLSSMKGKYLDFPGTTTLRGTSFNSISVSCHFELVSQSIISDNSSDAGKTGKDVTQTIGQVESATPAGASFGDNLWKLRESNSFTDFTFIASGVNGNDIQIPAHAAVLSTASDVFNSMFTQNFKELEEKQVTVPDIDADILTEMFRFIYTERIVNLKGIADKLLIAAEKYCLNKLKGICEASLADSVEIGNAVRYLDLAHLYRCDNLKGKVISFILANKDSVMETEEGRNLAANQPQLLAELFKAINIRT